MTLESIEYEVKILEGCKCEISYYKVDGKSYILINSEDVHLSLVKPGRVTNEFLLDNIMEERKLNLKEVMKIAEKIPW